MVTLQAPAASTCVELLDTIEREGVNSIAIVGDAFAKPIVRALDAEPDRWDLSSLVLITSSGVMFSEPVKQALLAHLDNAMIVDAFSSSEAVGMGQSVSSTGARGVHRQVHRRRATPGDRRRRHRRGARFG